MIFNKFFSYKDNKQLRNVIRIIAGILFALIILSPFFAMPAIIDFLFYCIEGISKAYSVVITNMQKLFPTWITVSLSYFVKIIILVLVVTLILLYILAISIAPSGVKGSTLLAGIRELFKKNKGTPK